MHTPQGDGTHLKKALPEPTRRRGKSFAISAGSSPEPPHAGVKGQNCLAPLHVCPCCRTCLLNSHSNRSSDGEMMMSHSNSFDDFC